MSSPSSPSSSDTSSLSSSSGTSSVSDGGTHTTKRVKQGEGNSGFPERAKLAASKSLEEEHQAQQSRDGANTQEEQYEPEEGAREALEGRRNEDLSNELKKTSKVWQHDGGPHSARTAGLGPKGWKPEVAKEEAPQAKPQPDNTQRHFRESGEESQRRTDYENRKSFKDFDSARDSRHPEEPKDYLEPRSDRHQEELRGDPGLRSDRRLEKSRGDLGPRGGRHPEDTMDHLGPRAEHRDPRDYAHRERDRSYDRKDNHRSEHRGPSKDWRSNDRSDRRPSDEEDRRGRSRYDANDRGFRMEDERGSRGFNRPRDASYSVRPARPVEGRPPEHGKMRAFDDRWEMPRRPSWGSRGGGDKWSHDKFDEVNRSPSPKKEDNDYSKIAALLAL